MRAPSWPTTFHRGDLRRPSRPWLGCPHLREGNGEYACLTRSGGGGGKIDMCEKYLKASP